MVQEPENRYLLVKEQLLPITQHVLELLCATLTTTLPQHPTTMDLALPWLLNILWFLHYCDVVYFEELIIYFRCICHVAFNVPVKLQ